MPTDKRMTDLAWAVVNRIRPRGQDRDDLFQVAFLAALESVKRVAERGGTVSNRYLYKTMFRRAMDHHLQTQPSQPGDDFDPGDDDPGHEAVNEADWVATKKEWLHANLHRLTDKQSEAIYLVCVAGHPLSDVARLQNVGKDAVCHRIRRGIEKLRALAKAQGEEE